MPTVQDVLAAKGFQIHWVKPSLSVLEAVRQMNDRRVGALIVMDEGEVVGIFTERDVLKQVVGPEASPATLTVGQVMTEEVICCGPNTDLEEASRIMKDRRIRHLPVCDAEGDLLGLISIGDINAAHAS